MLKNTPNVDINKPFTNQKLSHSTIVIHQCSVPGSDLLASANSSNIFRWYSNVLLGELTIVLYYFTNSVASRPGTNPERNFPMRMETKELGRQCLHIISHGDQKALSSVKYLCHDAEKKKQIKRNRMKKTRKEERKLLIGWIH